jgi:hypothetical protein
VTVSERSDNDFPEYSRSVFDADYWLSRAEGFAVHSPSLGRVGIVEELHFYSRHDRPDELLVRTGRFGRRSVVVATDDVETVLPREKRLILRADAAVTQHSQRRMR